MGAAGNRSARNKGTLRKNLLTGLSYPQGFMEDARWFIQGTKPNAYCMIAIDILHFRLFNKFHGRDMGDRYLRYIADALQTVRKEHGGVAGYFEGDNFCLIMPFRTELIQKLWDKIMAGSTNQGSALGVLPVFGVSPIDDPELPPEIFHDRATLARSRAAARDPISYYSAGMESYLEEEMHLLMEVTEALEQDEFTFFAQPQCDIFSGKVVGAESLVRWRHPDRGLIPPGKFIPVLERSGMIHLLDRQVWERVCQWLRSWMDRGYQPVPISINISRIDIMSMDVPAYLGYLLKKYDLPPKYLKAEITESAYAEEDDAINSTVDRLREAGLLVMMDDFGSGYSSLNMLKSVSVDVLKIDMRFLEIGEGEEQKGIGILESIVNMARMMGLPTIVEGVENLQQENVLRSMGCQYVQGYYYCKPLPIDQLEVVLADERRLDFSGLRCRQVESFHARELLDGNLFTDTMVNNILGAAAIYEVCNGQMEITRINEQGYRLAGLDVSDTKELSRKTWDGVRDDDRPVMLGLFERAYERRPGGAEGTVHYIRVDGRVLWIRMRVFFLREHEGRRVYFVGLTDITDLREHRREKAKLQSLQGVQPEFKHEQGQLDQWYGMLPCGFGLSRIALNREGEPIDYDIIYVNEEMERMCGGDATRLRYLILKAFGDDIKKLLEKAYRAAFLGERMDHYAYSSISGHYLQLTLFQHDYGYVACLLRDVTNNQVYEGAFSGIVRAFREVYYLQFQENYCRMLYPDGDQLLERGNYEAMVERHFGTGRIVRDNEEGVRQFLSLDNLRETLQAQDTVEYRYRRCTKYSPDEWCLTTVAVTEREGDRPKAAVVTIRSIDKVMKEEQERREEHMVETLATMSDAFFVYRGEGNEELLYANPVMAELFGCKTIAEFMEHVGRSFRGIVHPEDLDRVEWEITHQIERSDRNMDFVQYRIIRKDGGIRWVDDWGHLETSKYGEENQLFYVFVKDVTDTISEVQTEKLLNSNRYYWPESRSCGLE